MHDLCPALRLFKQHSWDEGDWLLFGALLKLAVEEAFGAMGVTGAAGSIRARSVAEVGCVV